MTTFDFSKHAKTLERFLQNVTPNKSSEFEIRFGNFVSENTDKTKKRFEASVEIDFFYRLKSFLKEFTKTQGGEFIKVDQIDYSYSYQSNDRNDRYGKIRRIVDLATNNETFMIKNSQRPFDIYDYNIRLSSSSEKFIKKPENSDVNWDQPQMIRRKNRFSYKFDFGRFDLTIVNTEGTEGKRESDIKYEVEMEIYVNNYDLVISFIEIILQIKQENFLIITPYERNQVLYQYKQLLGQPYFAGAQPQTLHKNQLTLLYKELYSVTDKADGDRCFMMIDKSGSVYFLDNNLNNVLKSDLKSEFSNCIIDGELVRVYSGGVVLEKVHFYAFDILCINSQDIRGNTEFLFKKRLDILKKITDSVNDTELYTCSTKQFIYRNVFMGSEIIMNDIKNKKYHNDGLIFTPMNEPYPRKNKWENLLKWKPAEQNTIDFYSVKKGDYWELYVQHRDTSNNQVDNTSNNIKPVLFDVNKLCPSNENETEITFKTTFSENELDPTTSEKYQSNTVIEYKWDFQNKKFVPMRTRWDKTANSKKHGNYSTVACDIWNNIQNPVNLETIYQMTNTNTDKVNDVKSDSFFFERFTVFHTKINSYLSNKYIKDQVNLLEINYKKGESLHLYKDKIVNLYGVDFENVNSKTNLTNIIKKAKQLKIQNYSFYDTQFDDCVSIVTKNFYKKCDTLFSNNNGLTNFFECENNMNQLKDFLHSSLNDTGNQSTIIISLIDSNEITNLKTQDFIENNEIMYHIKEYINGNFKKYSIFINGITNENDTITNVIDYTYFINFMKTCGFTLIESELYKTLYEMTDKTDKTDKTGNGCNLFPLNNYEKNVSFLYRYCVFSSSSTQQNITDFNTISLQLLPLPIKKVEKQETFVKLIDNGIKLNTIGNPDINLNVVKLENCLDILDILNCIEYKFNKHNFNDYITDFNLDNLFELTKKIDYNPVLFNTLNTNDNTNDTLPCKNLVYYTLEYTETIKEESVTLKNIYLVLYKNQINYNITNITNLLQTIQPKVSVNVENVQIENLEAQLQEIKITETNSVNTESVKKRFLECKKITIPIIKEFLKELNLNCNGNKNELLTRLNEAFV